MESPCLPYFYIPGILLPPSLHLFPVQTIFPVLKEVGSIDPTSSFTVSVVEIHIWRGKNNTAGIRHTLLENNLPA